MMRGFIAIVSLLLFVSNSFGNASQAGAKFLLIFPGARPSGMAASFSSIADDAMATYYNKAGAAFQESTNVYLMHSNWLPELFPDMYYEIISFVHPVEGWGKIGGHIIYLTTGETVATDPAGNVIAEYRTYDFAVCIMYAHKLSEKLGVGGGIKFIHSYLAPDWIVKYNLTGMGGGTGQSYAVDLSVLYKLSTRANIGFALQNLGPNISFIVGGTSSDPLPRTLKLGLSYRILNTNMNRLTVACEVTKILVGLSKDLNYEFEEAWKHFGVEYWFHNFFAVRGGYFYDREGHRKGPTFGGGIKFKKFSFDIGVDSAIYEFGGSNYRFSLGYTF